MVLKLSRHRNGHRKKPSVVMMNTLVVVPGPTATTVACRTLPWDFSGIMMPPFVTVSAANRSTNTLSNMGRNLRKALAYRGVDDSNQVGHALRQYEARFTST